MAVDLSVAKSGVKTLDEAWFEIAEVFVS